MSPPYFSIIIPAYNEAANIGRCLKALEANRAAMPDFEVLVVDNGSSDATTEIAAGFGARVLHNTSRLPGSIARSRNIGAAAAAGPVLVFLDADMLAPAEWLGLARARFDEGFEGLMAYELQAPPEAEWVGRIWGSRTHKRGTRPVATINLGSANMLVNRHVFEKVRGFNENLATAEDKDLAYRIKQAGYMTVREPSPVLLHLGYEKNLRQFARKEFWRQGSTLTFALEHGLSFRSLRNPLLSLYHVGCGLLGLALLALGQWAGAMIFMGAWVLPTLAMAARPKAIFKFPADRAGFFLLNWLRWNLAGAAIFMQIYQMITGKGKKSGGGVRRVIMTADDYGMCESVNRAIEHGARLGTITATCVMTNMPQCGEAKQLRERHPELSIGLHWTLTQGRPVAPPERVGTLVDGEGKFFKRAELRRRWRAGEIDREQVIAELMAQYDALAQIAGTPDFWNSHEHIHIWPGLHQVFLAVARRRGLWAMRSNRRVVAGGGVGQWRMWARQPVRAAKQWAKNRMFDRAERKGFRMPYGMLESGARDGAVAIEQILVDGALQGRSRRPLEYVVHPAERIEAELFGGLEGERLEEYRQLSEAGLVGRLAERGVELVNFKGL